MKHLIEKLNNTKLDNRVRLGIMSVLIVSERVAFNKLKEMLGVSDGNLASHLKVLEKEQYIDFQKQFVGRKPQTTYAVTELGRKAFEDHLNALEDLLKK